LSVSENPAAKRGDLLFNNDDFGCFKFPSSLEKPCYYVGFKEELPRRPDIAMLVDHHVVWGIMESELPNQKGPCSKCGYQQGPV
jgi:hypothetical protein